MGDHRALHTSGVPRRRASSRRVPPTLPRQRRLPGDSPHIRPRDDDLRHQIVAPQRPTQPPSGEAHGAQEGGRGKADGRKD
ncbi:hypothetical protein FCM35_KLT00304 [Carex littledalei]|uniref:Uncharacterized protein n=1 Tax=Carex littledalei TaxID=544730 RepID=A0A833VLB0_9POAL|nr:hypothetical protein FCM35_KLT00304 [Carex littledalei]